MGDIENFDRDDDTNSGFTTQRAEASKSRQCLKCREPFTSEWSGERICKRCKSSGSWHSGL